MEDPPLRPLPRRSLPPLQNTSTSNTKSVPVEQNESSKVDGTTSRSRQPRRKRSPRSPNQSDTKLKDESLIVVETADQGNESNISIQSKNARTRRRQGNRKRTTTSPEVITNGHALTNMLSEEDVVTVDRIDNMVSMTTLPGVAGNAGNSQTQEKVYIQTTSGFASHNNEWLKNREIAAGKHEMNRNGEESLITHTSQVALKFHRGFMFISLLIHGLLAGLAVWEVVVAFVLNSTSDDNFFIQYSILAQPTQTTYHVLLVLCLVSAMDRLNFAKPGRNFFIRLIKVEPGAWTVLVYVIAFMFNSGLNGLDYWLGKIAPQSVLNMTITPAYPNNDPAGSLRTWHVINVIRACFALIGWLLIAVYPTEDGTSKVGKMSWKYIDDLLLRLSKNSTLLGKYWVMTILLFRLVVLSVFGENVWNDEQREFTCNTKQPGCENVCFNNFTPVSNVRMWGLQMLAVSIPGAFYFVYVLHAVSRRKFSNDVNSKESVNCSGNDVISAKDKTIESPVGPRDSLRSAHKRWKVLTNHVIPSELHKSRARCIWRFYLMQIFLRIILECGFIMLQYTAYSYRWTVPEVFQCSEWPCPHIVDCFISRPHEKTVFFRYMYVISATSVLLSVVELCHIAWIGARNSCAKGRGHKINQSNCSVPVTYQSNRGNFDDDEKKLDLDLCLPNHEVRLKVNSMTYSSSCSDVTSLPVSPSDYVDMRPINRISYL